MKVILLTLLSSFCGTILALALAAGLCYIVMAP